MRPRTPEQAEKDAELIRQERRAAALQVVHHNGYIAGPATVEALQMLGLDDPELRSK